jgi:alpha/beta superfamily hydrolase
MKESAVTFLSDGLQLEGLIAKPDDGGPTRGAVVCHPHPLYGGSMYNNVVSAALEALWKLGYATLRFNFRGVGASDGEHAGGVGEADDARAAIAFLTSQSGVHPDNAILAGYSFGAMAAMRAAPSVKNLAALLLIALPLQMIDATALEGLPFQILLAAGDSDAYCPARQVEALAAELGERAQSRIITGADHFFGGREEDLTTALEAMLPRVSRPQTK